MKIIMAHHRNEIPLNNRKKSDVHLFLQIDIDFYDDIEVIDLSDYVENNMWEVVDHSAKKHVKYYACCPEPYPDLTFTLALRRKSGFYTYLLVLPVIVLSFLIPTMFIISIGRPEKLFLGMDKINIRHKD